MLYQKDLVETLIHQIQLLFVDHKTLLVEYQQLYPLNVDVQSSFVY